MKLNASATWYALTAVVVALILGAAWMLAISPKLQDGEQARSDTENVEHQNQILRTRIASLKSQASDLDTVLANMAAVHDHMPVSDAAPELIRSVWEAGQESGLFVADLVLGLPESLGASAPEQPVIPESDSDAQTAANLEGHQAEQSPDTPVAEGDTPVPDEAATPSAPAAEEAPAGEYVTGLYGIPITITGYGNHAEIEDFLARVQNLTRYFLVFEVGIETEDEADVSPPLPAMEMGDAMVTVSGYVYVLLPADSIEYEWPELPTGALPTVPEVPEGVEPRNPYIGLGRTPEEALGPGAILPEDGEDGEAPEGGLDVESPEEEPEGE